MRRETVALNRRQVVAILKRDHRGEQVEYADASVEGLSLRIRKKSSAWYIRGRVHGEAIARTLRIGDALTLDLAEVHKRAAKAKELFKQGIHPGEWLRQQEYGVKPVPATPEEAEASATGMTWEEVRDWFLEEFVLPNRRPDTYRDYRQKLCQKVVGDHLGGRYVKDITPDDIRALRSALWDTGNKRTCDGTIRVLKSCLSKAADNLKLGIDSPAASISPSPKGTTIPSKSPHYCPTPLELGQALRKLEQADNLLPQEKYGALLTIYSAQRRKMTATARVENFDFETYRRFNWCIWMVDHRKTNRHERPDANQNEQIHEIVLLSKALPVVQSLIAASRYGQLFPKSRKRRATDRADGPTDPSIITNAFAKLDLPFRPHGLRKAFTTYLAETVDPDKFETEEELMEALAKAESRLDDVKLVLDHAEGEKGSVTHKYYNRSQRLGVKAKIMKAWMDFLDDCYEMALKKEKEEAGRQLAKAS